MEDDLTTVYLSGIYDERDRWRSKIKEKIKELDEKSKYCAVSDLVEFVYKKEVLNELLED